MSALELRAAPPVILSMATIPSPPGVLSTTGLQRPRRVRKALLVALAASVVLHVAWTFWPVELVIEPDGAVLTATLTEMPPPPVPDAAPPPAPPPKRIRNTARRAKPAAAASTIAAKTPSTIDSNPSAGVEHGTATSAGVAASDANAIAASANDASAIDEPVPPPVALPPRVDLAYKVFLGTQGFMIGDATYRFEHSGDRYRISTVGQARGLAALLVRGTGKVESHGRITPNGLRPYEFAIERGSADRREVAFFDWDAGNVVLHDGATAQLEPPAFDPLTILWQPYFSPPGRNDQTFSLATTRKVARYTLTMQTEEMIAWRRGDILTERWHRRSEDGVSEAWFWLAPSMHYIPIKIRMTRTSRGTLEVLLDSIRADDAEAFGLPPDMASADAAPQTAPDTPNRGTADDIVYGMPGSPMPPMSARDLRGQ